MKYRMLLLGAVFAAAVAVLPAAQAADTCGYTPAANEQYVGSTTVDSTSPSGTSFALPASGDYRVVACGTWHNLPHGNVDAAFNSGDSSAWNAPQQGWPTIAPAWGELTVNGPTLWSGYSAEHVYSTTMSGTGSLSLLISDRDAAGNDVGWYGDNEGSLSVDVYRVNARPTTGDQCKKDGWKQYGVFKNQGDCVSFVATGGRNLPAGG